MSETTTEGGVTLTLSAEAAEQVRQFFAAENLDEKTAALRVSVMPGGCSGFEYALEVGIHTFNVESEAEVELVDRSARSRGVVARVIDLVTARAEEYSRRM